MALNVFIFCSSLTWRGINTLAKCLISVKLLETQHFQARVRWLAYQKQSGPLLLLLHLHLLLFSPLLVFCSGSCNDLSAWFFFIYVQVALDMKSCFKTPQQSSRETHWSLCVGFQMLYISPALFLTSLCKEYVRICCSCTTGCSQKCAYIGEKQFITRVEDF